MNIWIDGDACPVRIRELIFKAALRTKTLVTLVANKGIYLPRSDYIRFALVDSKFDAADHYIIKQSEKNDLVISSDILLASALVDKGVVVISSTGKLYNKENVKEAVAMRNLFQELREGQIIKGGPGPLSDKDIMQFANIFDRELNRLLRL